jgi:hypothetical protein
VLAVEMSSNRGAWLKGNEKKACPRAKKPIKQYGGTNYNFGAYMKFE